jgi:hypothetical protein
MVPGFHVVGKITVLQPKCCNQAFTLKTPNCCSTTTIAGENVRVSLAILGVVSTAVGVRWLQLFTFTPYREHLRHVMIPLGAIAVLFGLLMLYFSFPAKSKP